jgi:hypothetical protein
MKENDGGPAFPCTVDAFKDIPEHHSEGMTLRDYFAAHAPTPLQAMSMEDHCAYRYRFADAMIKASGQ